MNKLLIYLKPSRSIHNIILYFQNGIQFSEIKYYKLSEKISIPKGIKFLILRKEKLQIKVSSGLYPFQSYKKSISK